MDKCRVVRQGKRCQNPRKPTCISGFCEKHCSARACTPGDTDTIITDLDYEQGAM
jgi:hypothetical protein